MSFSINSISQTYINREWVEESPIVGSTIMHTSTIVANGKLLVTSNVVSGGGDLDIMTIKYDTNGDTLWMATYDGSAGDDDYGVELIHVSGYVYVVGAAKNTSTGYDYCVLKYNAITGSQVWAYNWNGAGNGDDIPTALVIENSGSIYVCGGTEATNGFSDYGVIKLSSSGSLGWVNYYDYNNLHDGATSIALSGFTNVIVTGGSAAAVGDWDIATLTIGKNSGSMSSSRTNITGATMVEAKAMATDSLNNIYITGYATVGGDHEIQTIKLDSMMALQWIADYEGDNDDIGNDIGLDAAGNIYITGYSEHDNGGFQAITIKYESDGDTLWTEFFGNVITENGVKARKMAVEPNGDVYITGTSLGANMNSFAFVKYDTDGKLRLSKEYQADSLDDDGFEIVVDGNDVYITGFTETISGRTMTSIKYALTEKDSAAYYDSGSGEPIFVERDLIVHVDISQIKHDKVDQLEFEFWSLDEIFDASAVTSIERALENVCGDSNCPVTVYRIFKHLQTDDTTTISRLGETIRIPQFWATFVFEFPEGVDVLAAGDSLELLFPIISYTMPNLIATTSIAATDDLYDQQASLHSTTDFDSAHINVEPAWDYTTGEPFVKVGVFDTGIMWVHYDFQNSSAPQYTRVTGGWDFQYGTSVFTAPAFGDVNGHGTNCAGIIGANRNNYDDEGIAGIAGGSGNQDSADYGVALYSLKIINGFWTSDLSYIADAIVTSSIDGAGPYNYGLHVANNSWHFHGSPGFVSAGIYTPANITLVTDAVHFANRAKVTFVAARGNFGYAEDLYDTITMAYPAITDADWVLCVGGTGTDGHYQDGVGTPGVGDGTEDDFATSRGWEIDVAAPACTQIVLTTDPQDNDPSPGAEFYYSGFSGASSGTAHVSGTVALLMSYLNDVVPSYSNLAPEDCEYVIEMTATDVNYVGVDSLTGYGRLNAGLALQQVDKNIYNLNHYDMDLHPDVTTKSLYSSNDTITIPEHYQNNAGTWFLPGDYVVTTYEINTVVTHNVVSPGVIVASWPRHSSSTLLPVFNGNDELLPRERVTLYSVNLSTASLTGYVYKVSDLSGTPLGWWPFDTAHVDINMAYSLLIDTTGLASLDEPESNNSLQLYPNPTNGGQTLAFECAGDQKLQITLVDISGNVVLEVYSGETVSGRNSFEIPIDKFANGVYFYNVIIGTESLRIMAVKTN